MPTFRFYGSHMPTSRLKRQTQGFRFVTQMLGYCFTDLNDSLIFHALSVQDSRPIAQTANGLRRML